MCIFRSEGRSAKWKRLDTSIKKSLLIRKGNYFDKESERIKKAGRNGSWFNVLSRVVDEDAPKLWSLADMEPDKSPQTLAEDLAKHFTEITNQSPALEQSEICLLYTSPSPRDS